jgi:preprotein translocase subunit SecF
MFDIIKYKKYYFIFSFLLIIPGLISLFLYGLNLSIDFTGGSRIALQFPQAVNQKAVEDTRAAFTREGIEVATIQRSDNAVFLRTEEIDEKENAKVISELSKKYKGLTQQEFVTIGPTVGRETALRAIQAIVASSVLIVAYIAWSFRKVPKPTSSWRFGVGAVVALLHDVLVLLGIFSLLGYFYGVEIDSLFITAVLTVIGFSVHDTIVVFDRIRENLLREAGQPFAKVVNDAILQTLNRSLNTSFTALLVLLALLLFGGESTRWFVLALFIGIASGTYSSIFNAAPLLVVWDEWDKKRKKKT